MTAPTLPLELIGSLGYTAAAVLMLLLGVLMSTTWRGRMLGGLLLAAILSSAIWAGCLAIQSAWHSLPVEVIRGLEMLRNLSWLLFLLRVLRSLAGTGQKAALLSATQAVVIATAGLSMLPWENWLSLVSPALASNAGALRLVVQLLLAILGLILIEQVYRNTPQQHRWGIKYLCIGVGSLFAFDFFFFADAVLFQRLDHDIWLARGAVNAIAVPAIAIAVARNPHWSFDLSVSRAVVFHSTALLATGIYLVVMASAGYYIRFYGGEWGRVFQPMFLFGAGLMLIVLLFSGQLRSRLKLFVSKHFFSYRYDYREEWLHLIEVLSGKALQASLPERVVYALGKLVESPGGAIWLRDDDGVYRFASCWNLPISQVDRHWAPSSTDAALEALPEVEDVHDADRSQPGSTRELPQWIGENDIFWLWVALIHDDKLIGFTLLARPRVPQALGWENTELLRTAARQAASYLALDRAAKALAEAQQFAGFNRLSAFVVHDLKNLVAQLSLITRNAERHGHNPEFIADAMQTIGNAVERMTRLLVQLRAPAASQHKEPLDLRSLLNAVVEQQRCRAPAPELELEPGFAPMIDADRDRLAAVIANVVQNAQEATAGSASPRVELRLYRRESMARIEIKDNGCGMDADFVRERLFRPFDSTKGLAGMGIGAYECRELVHSLGGHVDVESSPGHGTRFRIQLPPSPAAAPSSTTSIRYALG